MKAVLQTSSVKFFADILTGGQRKIDGVYVEYGPAGIKAGPRDASYFDNLRESLTSGFARVAITNSYIDKNNPSCLHFDAIVHSSDMQGADTSTATMYWNCGTLVSLGSDMSEDILVLTTSLSGDVPVVNNAYTAVHLTVDLANNTEQE